MKKRRFADGGSVSGSSSKPPKKDFSDRGFGGPGDDRYGNKTQQADDDAPNPGYRPNAAARADGPGLGLGKRRDYMINKTVDDATNGVETPQGNGMKKGGSAKGKTGGGGLGALAALQGAMAGAGGGVPGGAPMGPPPGAGAPPMGPPGGGMPPPGMKKGGHVHKMNEGGKPSEDEPMRQAKRKAKEFPADGKDVKEETGGRYAKGKALDKADGKNEKEEKGGKSGEMRYAKGGHVSGFRASAHGIESKGKTRGKFC